MMNHVLTPMRAQALTDALHTATCQLQVELDAVTLCDQMGYAWDGSFAEQEATRLRALITRLQQTLETR
jgi:hypothetical protein